MIYNIIQLLRPHQWVKNGVVLAGLVFSQSAIDSDNILTALLATALFCLLSSTVYIINDLVDAEADRKHPVKSKRPIASRRVAPAMAIILAFILGGFSLVMSFILNQHFFMVALAYFILNLLYSFLLKHIVIIDVMSIAAGFVLRALAGAVVLDVRFSGWLITTTFLLALFLGFGKRRHELILLEKGTDNFRRILAQYSSYLLDQLIGVVTPAVLVCYLLYAISPEVTQRLGTEYMFLTIPFVIYGIFRYMYLIYREEKGGSPTRILLTDWPIMITVLLWIGLVIYLLYHL